MPSLQLGVPATLALPVAAASTAATFQGTLNVQSFAARGNQIVAVAMMSGTAVGADGRVSTLLNGLLEVPVTVTPGATTGMSPSGALPADGIVLAQAPQTCGVLHLEFGAIPINALGVHQTTSPIAVDLAGETSGTNTVGALVCQILGARTDVTNLPGLLNQLLGVLAGLTGGRRARRPSTGWSQAE